MQSALTKSHLAIARAFHEFFRHSDFIEMAGFTMATNWLSFDRTHSVVNAYGRVFQLYNRYFGKIPVPVTGDSPVPPPKYPIGGDQPRVNTGSDTWPRDVSAALTADRRALIVAVVNAAEDRRTLNLRVQGWRKGSKGRCWKLNAPGLDAQNVVGKKPQVIVRSSAWTRKSRTWIRAGHCSAPIHRRVRSGFSPVNCR